MAKKTKLRAALIGFSIAGFLFGFVRWASQAQLQEEEYVEESLFEFEGVGFSMAATPDETDWLVPTVKTVFSAELAERFCTSNGYASSVHKKDEWFGAMLCCADQKPATVSDCVWPNGDEYYTRAAAKLDDPDVYAVDGSPPNQQ